MVTGQKVRWVLDLMRGTEFAGRDDHRRTRSTSPTGGDVRRDRAARGRPGRRAHAISPSCGNGCSSSATQGDTVSLRLIAAPLRRVAVRHRRDRRASAGRASRPPTATAAAAAPPTRSRATGTTLANEHLARRGRRGDRHVHDRDRRRRARGRARPPRRRRRRRRHLQLLAAHRRPRRRHARRGPRRRRSSTARYARGVADRRPTTRGRRTRSATCARAPRGATRRCRSTVTTTLELRAGEQFLRVAHELDNRARDHRLRAHFPLPGAGRRLRRRVRVRGGAPRAHRRRRRRTSTGCRRSRRAASSTRPTATAGLALVHDGLLEYEVVDDGRELALTLLRAVGYLSRSEPALRPNPAGPTVRSRARSSRAGSAPSTRCSSTAATGAPPTATRAADAFLVPFERARAAAAAAPGLAATGAALRVDGAEVSAVLRVPGRTRRARLPHRPRSRAGHASSTKARPPAAGSSTSRAARSRRSKARVELRPWEICTLQLHN